MGLTRGQESDCSQKFQAHVMKKGRIGNMTRAGGDCKSVAQQTESHGRRLCRMVVSLPIRLEWLFGEVPPPTFDPSYW